MKSKLPIVIFACFMAWLVSAAASGMPADTVQRRLTVHLRGVYDAKISVISFNGLKTIAAVAEVSGVKNTETATLIIPAQYLPGEFVLRFDYRSKESDAPYPSEKQVYINKQDLELFVNPPYCNNNDSTKFAAGETENTVYSAFMLANGEKRKQIDLLQQFLMSYDNPISAFYKEGVKEFELRRTAYNKWLTEEAKTNDNLYVGHLFQFNYIQTIAWGGSDKDRLSGLMKNYFEGIDFSDTMIIRSNELNKMMSDYMGLFGALSTTIELRDSLFALAGSLACEKASKGNPKVYGWMVDYFYSGYETYKIDKGMSMLQKHIDNPNCLTSKKQQIVKRLESMTTLVAGKLSPDFTLIDNDSIKFSFHAYKGKTPYKLLLFWSAGCEHCQQLVDSISKWVNKTENAKKIDIIAVSLDDNEPDVKRWKTAIAGFPNWKHLLAKEGVNSPVANDYAILSTPVMFLIDSESNIIKAVPTSFEELKTDLERKSINKE